MLSPATGQMVSLHRDGGNRHAATPVSGVRRIVDGVALFVRHVDELAIDARIDSRHGRGKVLRLRLRAGQQGRRHRQLQDASSR